jgi:hypothetical protein
LKSPLAVQVFASGYEPASKGLNFSQAEGKKTVDFVLIFKV